MSAQASEVATLLSMVQSELPDLTQRALFIEQVEEGSTILLDIIERMPAFACLNKVGAESVLSDHPSKNSGIFKMLTILTRAVVSLLQAQRDAGVPGMPARTDPTTVQSPQYYSPNSQEVSPPKDRGGYSQQYRTGNVLKESPRFGSDLPIRGSVPQSSTHLSNANPHLSSANPRMSGVPSYPSAPSGTHYAGSPTKDARLPHYTSPIEAPQSPSISPSLSYMQRQGSYSVVEPMEEPTIENAVELAGIKLGSGAWGEMYRRSQGSRRQAFDLLARTGIITPKELAEDRSTIAMDHVEECMMIAGEMLRRGTVDQWIAQSSEATVFFQERLNEVHQRQQRVEPVEKPTVF